MIYSIKQHKEIPINIVKEKYTTFTRYVVNDCSKNIGYVDLKDTEDGVKVLYIKNQQPKLYKHFGMVADQIELEHCLNRDIENPYIQSKAASGTLMQHFKRGKRYLDAEVNSYLSNILKDLKKGERVFTGSLGTQKMFMPINMINEIKEKIKIHPLLKGIK